jgi:TonB-dependent SusC/RagA subfamily outer membrane receptor
LIIVDDKEETEVDLSRLDPKMIESSNVIKDASATYKYGAKGKNGVIEITMKKNSSSLPLTLYNNDKQVLKGDITKLDVSDESQVSFEANSIIEVRQDNQNKIFTKVQEPGRIDPVVWSNFLGEKLRPIVEGLSITKAEGKFVVNLQFIINADGTLSDVKALNDPGYGVASKLIEMLQYSPKWTPAKQNGRVVRSVHIQPITLILTAK